MSLPSPQRLYQLLLSLGLFASRSRARDAIIRGTVRVGGEVVTKPGQAFLPDVAVAIADPAQDYVSRAALKLAAGLAHFQLEPPGRTCLALVASPGRSDQPRVGNESVRPVRSRGG